MDFFEASKLHFLIQLLSFYGSLTVTVFKLLRQFQKQVSFSVLQSSASVISKIFLVSSPELFYIP